MDGDAQKVFWKVSMMLPDPVCICEKMTARLLRSRE